MARIHFFLQLLIVAAITGIANGQSVRIQKTIKWGSPQEIKISKYDKLKMPWFEGASYLENPINVPWVTEAQPIASDGKIEQAIISKPVYQAVSTDEAAMMKNVEIGQNPILETHIIYEKKKPQLTYRLLPFRKQGGTIEKLVSYELQVTINSTNSAKSATRATTTTESVLNTGNWYKVGVTSTGVYTIRKSQLVAMGMNGSVNPQNLRVYGNGGAMLPERNNIYYPDDLIENAVYVAGEGDGTFDDGDFILFYAQGPTTWKYDTSKEIFKQTKNLYADTAWYFVTADAGPGKRLLPQAESDLTASATATTFTDYAFVENDEENLLISGRKFVGNRMEVVNSHAFSFNFPNLTSGPHKLASNLLARGLTATNYTIDVGSQSYTQPINGLANLDYLSTFARENESVFTFTGTSSTINVSVAKPANSSIGWIDYLTVNVQRNLALSGAATAFRNQQLVGAGQVVQYEVGNANSSTRIWEVTNLYDARLQTANLSGSTLRFKQTADSLREFVAVDYSSSGFPSPISGGFVPNQNLHGLATPDVIIVTSPKLLNQAKALAQHHINFEGYSVVVAEDKAIYNEFSSGKQDIAGIRNFVRMFYERGGSNPDEMPKYLILFGDGTYRPKEINAGGTTLLPTYESVESLNPIGSYASDDFFGLLDPTEGTSIQSAGAGALDIGVGRLPASNETEAAVLVNKIIHYSTSQVSMGDWRNVLCFVADDEDGGDHVDQAEVVSNIIAQNHPEYNIDKIYLDAYPQETGAGGQTYPQVNTAIANRVEQGALMVNYAGHGGEEGLALERIITIDEILEWENYDNMPLFLTATCEFSRFDDPDFTSAGEHVILNPQGGGIALFTTVRLTFSTSNQALNKNVMDTLLTKQNGNFQTLGDVLRNGKNKTGSSFNNRSFTLLGDPAMRLAYPQHQVITSMVGNKSVPQFPDTLSALEYVTISGFISTDGVNPVTDFNGIVTPTIFDKTSSRSTLGNDFNGSPVTSFQTQDNVIFRGPVSVVNGLFTFSFVVPKDINLAYGYGKISYYARKTNSLVDASGSLTNVIIGGFSENPFTDDTGPLVRLYMNNEQFVSGGITDENPDMLAFIEDDIGINTVGTGIGHDITAVLDGNSSNPYILNDFYESELDNFRKGSIRYPFRDLAIGPHTLTLKVWDVANNSATASIDFVVVQNEDLALEHVLNYPNPFSTNTQFFFEYNQPGVPVDVEIQIFTISGKIVKTLRDKFTTNGFRSEPIVWNGQDDYGDKIGRGVYLYKLKVVTPEGKSAEKIEKLVILN